MSIKILIYQNLYGNINKIWISTDLYEKLRKQKG